MNKEEKLFISLCDNPLIQKGWVPKVKDDIVLAESCQGARKLKKNSIGVITNTTRQKITVSFGAYTEEFVGSGRNLSIFLPSLDQLLDMLGERWNGMNPFSNYFVCRAETKISKWDSYTGISRRIAAIKAVLEVRKEEK